MPASTRITRRSPASRPPRPSPSMPAGALGRVAQRQPWHLRAGRLAPESPHGHLRPSLGIRQRTSRRPAGAEGRFVDHSGVLDDSNADLERLLASPRVCLRRDRRWQDGCSASDSTDTKRPRRRRSPSLYDPANGGIILQSLPWTDKNKDDIAQGAPGAYFGTAGCEINFASLPSNFGTVSLASPDPGLTRPYVLQFNAGIQRTKSCAASPPRSNGSTT